MSDLHIDLESRSTVDLRDTGVYPYAMHPSTDVWCAAYAFGDEPIQLWKPNLPLPEVRRPGGTARCSKGV